MEVDCAGCAGCCIDWRPVAPTQSDHERRGKRVPLDDAYNFVPLVREEVRRFVTAGYGDALTPRLWRPAEGDDHVVIDGEAVAAIEGRPVFFVGLRCAPKPVAPFGGDRRWLRACVFLDPTTLQCRIHEEELYPGTCADYPGHNLALGVETECERVEAATGDDRLRSRENPATTHLRLNGGVLGAKVFAHPDPARLDGVVSRLVAGTLKRDDRAEFVGCAVASTPGTLDVDDDRVAEVRTRVAEASSWVGAAVEAWADVADDVGTSVTEPPPQVEERRGAPPTPGWGETNGDKG